MFLCNQDHQPQRMCAFRLRMIARSAMARTLRVGPRSGTARPRLRRARYEYGRSAGSTCDWSRTSQPRQVGTSPESAGPPLSAISPMGLRSSAVLYARAEVRPFGAAPWAAKSRERAAYPTAPPESSARFTRLRCLSSEAREAAAEATRGPDTGAVAPRGGTRAEV